MFAVNPVMNRRNCGGACAVAITFRKIEVTFCECLLFCGSSLTSSYQLLSYDISFGGRYISLF